jgi:hypothetical protein
MVGRAFASLIESLKQHNAFSGSLMCTAATGGYSNSMQAMPSHSGAGAPAVNEPRESAVGDSAEIGIDAAP